MRRRRKDADAARRGWDLTNRSRTRMEYGDRSREPSVRRAPSRFVRRPGNPECGFVRRPTFLFLPRSFGLLLVALFAFSPPFLRPQRKREMHAFRCCRRQWARTRVLVSSFPYPHPLAYQLASPECSVRDVKSNFPSLPPFHEKLQTFFFLRAKNEETSSPLLPNWPKPNRWYSRLLLLPNSSLRNSETKPFHFDRFESAYRTKSDSFFLQFLQRSQFQRLLYELIFSGIPLVPFKHPDSLFRSSKLCNFLLTFANCRIIRSLNGAGEEEKRGGARRNFRIQNSVNVTWLSEDLSRGSGRGLWRGWKRENGQEGRGQLSGQQAAISRGQP